MCFYIGKSACSLSASLALWLDLCDNNGVGVFRCADFCWRTFCIFKEENKMKKEIYEKPELEVIELSDADIVCASGRPGKDDDSNDGEWM